MIEIPLSKLINDVPVGYLTDKLWITQGGKVLPLMLNEYADYELEQNPQDESIKLTYEEYELLTRDYFSTLPKVDERLPNPIKKHLQGQHDQSSHGRKGPIKSGYENWNSEIAGLLERKDALDSSRGNATLATFTEAAGFNGKPTVLSQAEFDALEGETIYRGVTSESHIADYKESLVPFAGEGSFGNGTYTTNDVESTRYYTGAESNFDRLTMEMKLLPNAKVMNFKDPYELKEWRSNLAKDFVAQYKASGKNPAEVLDVEWNLANDGDWTNIAIMNGIDAIRFNPIGGDRQEFYTIVLNRGKVAINGKS